MYTVLYYVIQMQKLLTPMIMDTDVFHGLIRGANPTRIGGTAATKCLVRMVNNKEAAAPILMA